MFSGQTNTTPSLNIDGYFTDYPSSSTVLLRRTANGQPAMIMYDYGAGKVIATTMYSDFAYGHGFVSLDELNLIRDLINWAKKPVSLPETKPGNSLSILVTVHNNTGIDATEIRFSVYDMLRKNLIMQYNILADVPAGQSAQIPVSVNIQDNKYGIYHIDYTLVNTQINPSGIIIQPPAETDDGRFIISNPPKVGTPDKPLWFSASTSSQDVIFGLLFDYTFHVWNNTDVERNLKIKAKFPHAKIEHEWNITANPNSETTLTISELFMYGFGAMWAYLYDETNKIVAGYTIGFRGTYPSPLISTSLNKSIYIKGDNVIATSIITNDLRVDYQVDYKIKIVDPSGNIVFQEIKEVNLPALGSETVNSIFMPADDLPLGSYAVFVELLYKGKRVSDLSKSFEVEQSKLTLYPAISSLSSENIATPFVVSNIGKVDVNSGISEMALVDPEGIILSSQSQNFAVGVNQTIILNFAMAIPPLKFGTYILNYTLVDETGVNKQTFDSYSNGIYASISLDKESYAVRESANVEVLVRNTGNCNTDANLIISIPDSGYTDTTSFYIEAMGTYQISKLISISDTLLGGAHEIIATVLLPSGDSTFQSRVFNIPQSNIEITYNGPAKLYPGDTMILNIENNGGADTNYIATKLELMDSRGYVIYNAQPSGSILAGESKTLTEITIPLQVKSDSYLLEVLLVDTKTNRLSELYENLDIVGIEAGLTVITDKEYYLASENISSISTIANGAFDINNGVLELKVNRYKKIEIDEFSHFLPKSGWHFYMHLSSVAVAADGSIYAVDSINDVVLKYSNEGSFIAEWGGAGSGDGQFLVPTGITVSSDGYIYVLDSGNNRIEKFDSNGNFIMKWGDYGSGESQFDRPFGVAVSMDGYVYVSDKNNNRIQKFDSNGVFVAMWVIYGTGDGEFTSPSGIAIGSDGSVYVADTYNNRIQRFDGNGNFINKWGSFGNGNSQFNNPHGIEVSADGYVYVADTENNRIQKFDTDGNFITKWGVAGRFDGAMLSPMDVAVDLNGFIYLADTENERIQKFEPTGHSSYIGAITILVMGTLSTHMMLKSQEMEIFM